MPPKKPASTSGYEVQCGLGPAKLKRLIIKNFRCIGDHPVEIDLDEIVVLVGANNAGKSTILRAYEVVMCHGTTEGKLSIADFPCERVDAERCPQIELQTYIDPDTNDKPGTEWWHSEDETGRHYVRELWTWSSPNQDPVRQGRKSDADEWSASVPWGAPNIAKANRPLPHRVDAFSAPENQAKEVIDIIKTLLQDSAKKPGAAEDPASAFEKLKAQIVTVQSQLIESSRPDIEKIQDEISAIIAEIFKGFRVTIDSRREDISDKAFSLFSIEPVMRMGPTDGHASPIDKQGSGARRTLLWSALKLIGDRGAEKKSAKSKAKGAAEIEGSSVQRPHVLLMDEPELCLHPNAIRDACRVLYDLSAEGSGWQVMVTTHSPAFIDISRNNTTIVRVERAADVGIRGTTVFRPSRAKLDDDDKKMLKRLNIWDPYVAEFFFGGRSIIVEGDTEYSAFQLIRETERETFGDVHIIRARGKFIIPALIKVLNQFGSAYAVLHDSDRPTLDNDNANSAWAGNKAILEGVKAAPLPTAVRVVASIPNFERALFGLTSKDEKPYRAVAFMQENIEAYNRVRSLLTGLLDSEATLPAGTLSWNEIAHLEAAIASFQ